VDLLERDELLAALTDMRTATQTGSESNAGGSNAGGFFAFVAGEAGAGKSALVRALAETVEEPAIVLWGSCDPLSSPRPFGPLHDIAPLLGNDVERELRSGDRDRTFDVFIRAFQQAPTGTVVVFEDVHWADVATLDFLRFLGRRLDTVSVLVVATYRDDQLDAKHLLRIVLGDLVPERDVARLRVPLLSTDAVSQLAEGTGLDSHLLHEETGGNPFFVTELIADGGSEIPANVSDAILGRVARLSPPAQLTLRAAAIIGTRTEPALITAIHGVHADALDECVDTGMLLDNPPYLVFRHELVRQAVLDAIAPRRLVELHAEVLDVLRNLELDPRPLARLAEHAQAAGDRDAVLEYAIAAGDAAASLKSHRDAAYQYERAWSFASGLAPRDKVDLLTKLSYECYLTDRLDDASAATTTAIELLREMDSPLELGDNLRQLGRIHRWATRRTEADIALAQSLEVLEAQSPGRELAYTYATIGGLHMVSDEWLEAIEFATKGLDLARALGEQDIVANALNSIGVARVGLGDPTGEDVLLESLALSLDLDLEDDVGRAWSNLASVAQNAFDLDKATKYINEGVEYCIDHDLYSSAYSMRADLASITSDRGDWDEALAQATNLLGMPVLALATRANALNLLGTIRARRGEPGVWDALDQARDLAQGTGELQFLAPIASARAEAHLLAGDLDRIPAEVESAYELAQRLGISVSVGQLGLWLLRAGAIETLPDSAPPPFSLQAAGDFLGAARAWEDMGVVYQAAACRAESNDEALLREAINVLEPLGARPMLAIASRNLRALGVVSIPRGPRRTTKDNPGGLTAREFEVAKLMRSGLRNSEIAERLFLSEKTVDHHVSAVLAKLQVARRTDTGRRLAELGVDT
jgi:DNA-binding CsgD family transcriptional regulator/tetratricopeptide (TPR) repeat protein